MPERPGNRSRARTSILRPFEVSIGRPNSLKANPLHLRAQAWMIASASCYLAKLMSSTDMIDARKHLPELSSSPAPFRSAPQNSFSGGGPGNRRKGSLRP